MRKQISQNERQDGALSELEAEVLKSAAISAEELDRIVSAPQVFDGVKARIRSEQAALRAAEAEKANRRPMFAFLNWQYGAAAFASLIFLVLASYGIFLYAKQKSLDLVDIKLPKPASSEQVAQKTPVPTQQLPQTLPDEDVRPIAAVDAPEEREIRRNIAVARTSHKKIKRSREEVAQTETVREFYPVSYTNGDDASLDMRIVRVELPRTSAISMGIDVPMHNGAETVKADLLVSADGVTKGFRLVD